MRRKAYTPHGLAENYIRAAEEYHFDGILVSILGRDPEEKSSIQEEQKLHDGSKLVTFRTGQQYMIPHNDFPYPLKEEQNNRPSEIDDISVNDIHLPMTKEEQPSYSFNILEEILERK